MAAKKASKQVNAAAESGREKALEEALKQIRKDFGEGAVMKMGERSHMNVDVISTGNIAVDYALGVGGLPKGRIVEIYGPEASGKTTLALHCVAQVQKAGGIAAFIDAEHALDPVYAAALGVDINELFVSQPDNGEQALEICEMLIRSGAIDIVVIDSVAALVPKVEIEGDIGDSHVGLQARLMSQALRKLAGLISRTNAIAIFINQLRDKIGNIGYGSPETTTGGKALKFYATIRIDVRRAESIKVGDSQIGSNTKIKIVKNKVAPPFKVANVDMIYGEGLSNASSVLDMAVDRGIIKKSGAWFSYEDQRLGQGRENTRKYLRDNPEFMAEIEALLRQELDDAINEHKSTGVTGVIDEDGSDGDDAESGLEVDEETMAILGATDFDESLLDDDAKL